MRKQTSGRFSPVHSKAHSKSLFALLVGGLGLLTSALAPPLTAAPANYAENLELIRSVTSRNRNHDNSAWRNTPQDSLIDSNHLGPRSDYLGSTENLDAPPFWPGKEFPGSTPEGAYPDAGGGQFRVACEFSHFAYDDPLIFPGQPGASHLHMFFGNTDVNAFSTYETLINSGSSTCNGQELNRTGYWMPALFDDRGNVRIPMRAIVYYKGYGLANGRSQVYPPGAAIIAMRNLHLVSPDKGGVQGFEKAYQCSDQFRGGRSPQSNNMPNCPGGDQFFKTIELHVKFPNCWNGDDPSDPANWRESLEGVWYYSSCLDWITTPNIEYIIQYQVEQGEDTSGWFLASDVNRITLAIDKLRGSTLHADWWGGWDKAINQEWLDNCVNFKIPGVPTGCGFGYLSDNGPDRQQPLPGRALKLRPQYDRPQEGAPKVAAAALYAQLCPDGAGLASPEAAAYCTVAEGPGARPEPAPIDPVDPVPPVSEPPAGDGLAGRYYDDRFYGTQVGERRDGPINIDLNRRIPSGSGVTDAEDVSIEWQGFLIVDETEDVRLWTRSDDGVRVYVDGELVIDNWTEHPPTVDTAAISLVAGKSHAISVQYFQNRGQSKLLLGWQRPGDRWRLIPRKHLYSKPRRDPR